MILPAGLERRRTLFRVSDRDHCSGVSAGECTSTSISGVAVRASSLWAWFTGYFRAHSSIRRSCASSLSGHQLMGARSVGTWTRHCPCSVRVRCRVQLDITAVSVPAASHARCRLPRFWVSAAVVRTDGSRDVDPESVDSQLPAAGVSHLS